VHQSFCKRINNKSKFLANLLKMNPNDQSKAKNTKKKCIKKENESKLWMFQKSMALKTISTKGKKLVL
jgi:hypothetical protein